MGVQQGAGKTGLREEAGSSPGVHVQGQKHAVDRSRASSQGSPGHGCSNNHKETGNASPAASERESALPDTGINNLLGEEMHIFLAWNSELELEREEHSESRAQQKPISKVWL